MDFRILGTLELWNGGSPVPLTAPKQRALLAILLIKAGRPVPVERLVDELWGATPPRSVESTLHSLISRLRGRGVATLVREPGGYRLGLEGATLDARVFEWLAVQARELAEAGRLEHAARRFREALDLWRAPALADAPESPMIEAERARLDGLRLAVFEEYADTLAGLGRHAQVAGELRALLAEHPLRESLWARMIAALDRSGQPREALAAYGEARRVLAEELGLDPGSELRRLQAGILRRENKRENKREDGRAARGPISPQLPPDLAQFTGRGTALRELTALMRTAPGTVAVVSGMPGVGKSAFAVHWAHRMAKRFPDGQIFIDLRGHRPQEAITPRKALDRFVRALGMPPEQVPAGEDELATAYRTLLAGRRVLVVLDNAADPEQVEPLLPGTDGCLALVTSRNRLSGLALRHVTRTIDLDILAEPEAVALLAAVIGPRADAEPAAVAELADQCGQLPLALRIAAAHLAGHPNRRVATYLADLTERGRLNALRLGDVPATAVRATFDLSYQALAEADQIAFRRLGLVPGSGFTAQALAAMLDVSAAQARTHLDALRAASLIHPHRSRPRQERYQLHDLLLDYARDRAQAEDAPPIREESVRRLLEWYLTIDDPLVLQDEHENMMAGTRHAAEHRMDAAWRLPAALAQPLRLRHCLTDTAELHTLAATAAERTGRQPEAAVAHHNLGAVLEHLGRYPEALAEHRRTLEIYRQLKDQRGMGTALRSIGTVSWLLGRYGEALTDLQEARRLLEGAGADAAVGQTLNMLGIVLRNLGRLEEAVTHYERALAIHQRTHDLEGEANTLNNLGVAREAQDRHAEALELYRKALALRRAAGSRKGEARALNNIGLAEAKLGRLEPAREHLLAALASHRESGDLKGEGQVTNDLAGLYHRLGREEEARTHFAAALRIRSGIGDRRGLAETHRDLGEALADQGDATAHHHLAAADQLFQELGVITPGR
ncbi:tetratricopeptide repeat protein [Nonomuraea sp. NPDC049028]|uniref:AfsR/SARP family transcriptional regulator n=1 Tax=Nonomuraea sp. NPDC049028 TaxID=3364348 RepID=UPI003714B731